MRFPITVAVLFAGHASALSLGRAAPRPPPQAAQAAPDESARLNFALEEINPRIVNAARQVEAYRIEEPELMPPEDEEMMVPMEEQLPAYARNPPPRKQIKSAIPNLEIVVGKSSRETKTFRHHSVQMALLSDFIDEQLAKGKTKITLPDIAPAQWNMMMAFLEPGCEMLPTFGEALELASLYGEYDFHVGTKICDRVISSWIDEHNNNGEAWQEDVMEDKLGAFLAAHTHDLERSKAAGKAFLMSLLAGDYQQQQHHEQDNYNNNRDSRMESRPSNEYNEYRSNVPSYGGGGGPRRPSFEDIGTSFARPSHHIYSPAQSRGGGGHSRQQQQQQQSFVNQARLQLTVDWIQRLAPILATDDDLWEIVEDLVGDMPPGSRMEIASERTFAYLVRMAIEEQV